MLKRMHCTNASVYSRITSICVLITIIVCMYFKVAMYENKIYTIFSDSRQKIDMTIFSMHCIILIESLHLHTLKLSQREVLQLIAFYHLVSSILTLCSNWTLHMSLSMVAKKFLVWQTHSLTQVLLVLQFHSFLIHFPSINHFGRR